RAAPFSGAPQRKATPCFSKWRSVPLFCRAPARAALPNRQESRFFEAPLRRPHGFLRVSVSRPFILSCFLQNCKTKRRPQRDGAKSRYTTQCEGANTPLPVTAATVATY